MTVKGVCYFRNISHALRFYSSIYRSITVRPSLRPYSELAVISPGVFKIPKKPFDLTVKYADSSPYEPKPKTVVAIHGTPGSCQHFEGLVKHFEDSENVRVVALSLPDFSHTRKTKHFWHTTPERVNFVRQFLHDLHIDTIDCLVSHSFGVQAAMTLCDNPENLKIRSTCMFAPNPFWDFPTMQNHRGARALLAFNNNLWYNLLGSTGIHRNKKFVMSLKNIDELLLMCALSYDKMCYTFEDRLRRVIANTSMPASVLYGTNEKLISKEARAKMNSLLGLRLDQVVQLDAQRHSANDVVELAPRFNSYNVEGGGHFVHIKSPVFAHRIVENLLAKV